MTEGTKSENPMSTHSEADRDELAALLEAHHRVHTCRCGDRNWNHPEHLADTILASSWLARVLREAAAQALRDAAGEIYNGAGDPEQQFYDMGVSPWLERRALLKEVGQRAGGDDGV